jgi:hypothetical protein
MNFFINKKEPKYVDFFYIKKHINDSILINTLPLDEQDYLIIKTLIAEKEVIKIQTLQENFVFNYPIIIYGRNCIDTTVEKKFHQLVNLGFTDVSIYKGGLFEWALLQDIYGEVEFPSTKRILDPLKLAVLSSSPNQETSAINYKFPLLGFF